MADKVWDSDELVAATAVLSFSGNPMNGNTVTIGGSGTNDKVYTFQTTLTNVDGNVLRSPSDGDVNRCRPPRVCPSFCNFPSRPFAGFHQP